MNKHKRYIPKFLGYTLMEILIALALFAILASLSASAMHYAFNTRDRVNQHMEQLAKLQLVLTRMNNNFAQANLRSIRIEDMQLLPPLIGDNSKVEFTHGGLINPEALEKKASLQHIAYICTKNGLIERLWSRLDAVDYRHPQDKVLLEDVAQCKFAYLNRNLQLLTSWRGEAINQNKAEPLPKAVQLTLTLKDKGTLVYLFIIPRAIYAKN